MKCFLCDTANADSADFCSQCGIPLVARECAACGAVFDKTANQCPKCGKAVPITVDSTQPVTNPPVAAELSAAVVPSAPAVASEAQLTARLVQLLEQIESELAARRVAAAAPLEEAPARASPGLSAQAQRTVAPTKPKRAAWLATATAGLVIAAAGALFYQFHDRFDRQAQTLPANVPLSGPAVAAGLAAAPAAETAASATMAAQSEPASALAIQPGIDDRAAAEPPDAALSMAIARDSPANEAAPPAPAPAPPPNAELLSATTVPQASEPPGSGHSGPARSEPAPSSEKRADTNPTGAREVVVAPTPGPKPAADPECRDNAIAALGLCGVTTR